jgi:acetyltransferase-like isoleucine patch superfamily enzyme
LTADWRWLLGVIGFGDFCLAFWRVFVMRGNKAVIGRRVFVLDFVFAAEDDRTTIPFLRCG